MSTTCTNFVIFLHSYVRKQEINFEFFDGIFLIFCVRVYELFFATVLKFSLICLFLGKQNYKIQSSSWRDLGRWTLCQMSLTGTELLFRVFM